MPHETTEADLQRWATVADQQGPDQFEADAASLSNELYNLVRDVSGLERDLRTAALVVNAASRTRVPESAAENADSKLKWRLDAIRRRLRPRLASAHRRAHAVLQNSAWDYLNSSHRMRSVRTYRGQMARLRGDKREAIDLFHAKTPGGILTFPYISEFIHHRAIASFERYVARFEGAAFETMGGWEVEAVTIQDITLGPWFAVLSFNPRVARAGRSQMLPTLWPKRGARLAQHNATWYWHPHVNTDGNICYGDMSDVMCTLLQRNDFFTSADIVDSIVESWNPASPYCPLGLFGTDAVKLKWLCSCGRQSKGSEPANDRTGITFVSCSSCAGDVCSRCVTHCVQCSASVALCRDCQRYMLHYAVPGAEGSRHGPVCQDCYDLLIENESYSPLGTIRTPTETQTDDIPF